MTGAEGIKQFRISLLNIYWLQPIFIETMDNKTGKILMEEYDTYLKLTLNSSSYFK